MVLGQSLWSRSISLSAGQRGVPKLQRDKMKWNSSQGLFLFFQLDMPDLAVDCIAAIPRRLHSQGPPREP